MGAINILFTTLFTGVLITNSLSAVEITSDELINRAKEYDKKEVVYSGEAIGDIMKRDQYGWINVSDGNNAIGIWLPFAETEKIEYTGQYKYTGDTVRIEGIFNNACSEHGGDLDIHAKSVEVVKKGFETKRKLNFSYLLAGAILFIIALGLNLLIFRKKM
jgi:hypothetical protein